MLERDFNEVVENTLGACRDLLLNKNAAYNAGTDKLASFKKAAGITGGTQEQALWGMAAKHLVSISDMVKSGEIYPPDVWDEKIGDMINYGVLLRACVEETDRARLELQEQTLDIEL